MDATSSQFPRYNEPFMHASETQQSVDSQPPFHFQNTQPYTFPPYASQYPLSSQLSQRFMHPFTSQTQVPTHQPIQEPCQPRKLPQGKKSKNDSQKKRTGNFTPKEDDALVRAWIAVSGDGIIGNSQSRNNLWIRIQSAYNDFLGVEGTNEEGERNPNSLSCRWKAIQHQVNKFVAHFSTIERNSRSGTTFDDWVEDAKKLFRSCEGCEFKMEELWKILRDNPKFNEKYVAPKRKPVIDLTLPPGANEFSQNNESSGDGDMMNNSGSSLVDEDNDVGVQTFMKNENGAERPKMGRKKSKERKSKGVSAESSTMLLKDFISKFDETMKQQYSLSEREIKGKEEMMRKDLELKERQLEQKTEILRHQERKMRMTQWLAEKDILEKDLASMSPTRAEMYHQMQKGIMEKWKRDGPILP